MKQLKAAPALVFSYFQCVSKLVMQDSEKPCNHAGYRAFLLRQNGDLTIILTTNTPVLTARAGCHSPTSGGSKLSIALRSLA